MLRQNNPVFGQQTADLVDELSAAANQPTAHAVKALKILLLDRLLRNESHVGPRYGLADRLGIVGIVLLRLHVRLDELRRHQTDRVTLAAEHSRPIMRAATCLNANQAG